MPQNDYPKGSRLNPYTAEEHAEHISYSTWNGGYAVSYSGSILYYTANDMTITQTGFKNDPFDYGQYQEMCSNGSWLAGWVSNGGELYYISGGAQYDETYGIFGSEDNPIPIGIYPLMCKLGYFSSGWIEYEPGLSYYVDYYVSGSSSGGGYGCGCDGSGNGEGSGSAGSGSNGGSGSGAGSGNGDIIWPGIVEIGRNGDVALDLEWNADPTFRINECFNEDSTEDLESFAESNNLKSSYVTINKNVIISWTGGNYVNVSGGLIYEKTTIITKKDQANVVVGTLQICKSITISPKAVSIIHED